MSAPDPIHECLSELRRRLRSDPLMASRVLREIADHLADSLADELRAGTSVDEARRRAVRRFGDPREFVRQLGDHATLRVLALAGSVASAVVGSLLVLALLTVIPEAQTPIWSLASAGFLLYGALTWIHLARASQHALRAVLTYASMAAVLFGISVFAYSVYLGAVTDDWEGYISAFGLALAGHGSVLLAYFTQAPLAERHPARPTHG